MDHDIGILFSSANLAACLSGKRSYEVMPLYEKYARLNKLRPIFFQLSHINFRDLTVNGFVKTGNKYVQKKVPLPTVIHNRTRLSPLHEKPLARLRHLPYTKVFNGTNYFNKLHVFRQLRECKELIPHLPDTEYLKPVAVYKLLERHPALYLKPFAKSLGRGVLRCVGLPDQKMQISFQKNGSIYQRTLAKEEAMPFIRNMCNNRYLVQQAISLVDQNTRPIDFRVSVQKGERGQWGVTGIVARMGLNRAIVTNVAAGGTCAQARPLLKEQFPKTHQHIYRQLRDVGIRVAKQLEKSDPTCADLGLDLAVDKNGHIWFIEVNGRDLRITFRHAKEHTMWHNTFRRPMEYAAYLKKQHNISTTDCSEQPSVSILTPGALPLLAEKGGSVETAATRLAEKLAPKTTVRTIGVTTTPEQENTIGLIAIKAKDSSSYLKQAIMQIRRLPSEIIQIENRPTFVPVVRKAFPRARIILSLHSVSYVNPTVLRQHSLQRALAACDAVVTNSDFLKREVQKLAPPFTDKIHRIHLGVDAETFRPINGNNKTRKHLREKLNLGDKPTVLFIGRLIPQKGLHILITAIEHVQKEVIDATLVVVGSPFYGRNIDTPYVRHIKKHASQLEDSVRFVPFVSPQKIQDYYSVGDVFVTPSLGKEAFGLVNVEAMASSLPVVAHDVGGISEVVEHGKTGYLTQPGSAQLLADSITRLLTDHKKRKAFGKAARKRVESYFTWDRVAENYRTLYAHLVNEAR